MLALAEHSFLEPDHRCVPSLAAFKARLKSQCSILSRTVHCQAVLIRMRWALHNLLWPPYGIGQAIIFLPCGFYRSFFFLQSFSSPNFSGRRLDVYHTSAHGVALVRT